MCVGRDGCYVSRWMDVVLGLQQFGRGPDVLITTVPGPLPQAQSGTPCTFSRSDSDTAGRPL